MLLASLALAGCAGTTITGDGTAGQRAGCPSSQPPALGSGETRTVTRRGGPGYTIKDEPVTATYRRGTVAMARTPQPDSQGSQFFIVLADDAAQSLAAKNTYAIFGTVTAGMDAVDAIAAAADKELPTNPIAMDSVTVSTP
jgi:cyclophilin family peptidyl-prolyl cis-trans isomerase